ncbi:MAG TPA: metalloprotease, partial [Streptomyces sp.]|nr:metalloprotease [Streptomyces sp.]
MLDSRWFKAVGVTAAMTLATVTAAHAVPAPDPAAESSAAAVTLRYDDSRA